MILGICGNKGSGKTTLANMMIEMVPGAQAIAFADPLKDFVVQVYGWPLRLKVSPGKAHQ